jgi:hypothetical protein
MPSFNEFLAEVAAYAFVASKISTMVALSIIFFVTALHIARAFTPSPDHNGDENQAFLPQHDDPASESESEDEDALPNFLEDLRAAQDNPPGQRINIHPLVLNGLLPTIDRAHEAFDDEEARELFAAAEMGDGEFVPREHAVFMNEVEDYSNAGL